MMLALYLAYLDDENDKKLFEEIFYAYRKQMVTLALSILNNENDAEDAVHNVFLRIAQKNWNTVRTIENKTDLRNYLLKATKNASLNFIKIKNRDNVSLDSIVVFDLYDSELLSDDSFIDTICTKIEYDIMIEAIKSLDDKYRNVIYYHLVMELPIIKTAQLLGQTVAATQKQLFRGKKMFYFIYIYFFINTIFGINVKSSII